MKNEVERVITKGPDRYLLQESLFSPHRPRITVTFSGTINYDGHEKNCRGKKLW